MKILIQVKIHIQFYGYVSLLRCFFLMAIAGTITSRGFFYANELTILILIEHCEHLLELALRDQVDVTLVVAKQGTTDERELGKRQAVIARNRN